MLAPAHWLLASCLATKFLQARVDSRLEMRLLSKPCVSEDRRRSRVRS
jgi:hypothetical protein